MINQMMINQWRFLAALVLCGVALILAPTPAMAQTAPPASESRIGHVNAGADFGPLLGTSDGTTIGFALHGDYFFSQNLAVGPLLQIGVDNNFTLVGISAQLKYLFDLPTDSHVHPNIQAGLGYVHVGDRRSDSGFLMPIGGGIDVDVTKNLSLGTTLLINLDGMDDEVFLSWFFGFRVLI